MSSRELEQALSRPLSPLYVLASDEPLLLLEARDALRAKAREAGHEAYSLMLAGKGFDWAQFAAETGNRSLFGERKLIDLRLDAATDPKTKAALLEYFGNPDPDTVLMLSVGRLSKKEMQAHWYPQAARLGPLISLWPPQAHEFSGWLQARCRQADLRPSPEALALLAERTEGHLLAAAQEITKLKLLAGANGQVGLTEALAAVGDNARFDVFRLNDCMLAGKPRESWRALQGLRSEGVEALSILWSLGRDLRLLLTLGQQARHSGIEAAMASQHVLPMRRKLVAAAHERIPRPLLWQLLGRLSDADQAVKGLQALDPWLVLEEVVMRTASSARY